MATAIAIIEHLGHDDHGFGWGSDRRHRLLLLGETLCDELRDLMGADAARDTVHDVAETIMERLHLSPKDVAVVDTDDITSDWPSAGDADAWSSDVWLGLADYLSYRHWCRLCGVEPSDYTLADEYAQDCVRNSGANEVRKALRYVTDSDPIFGPLTRALAKYDDED